MKRGFKSLIRSVCLLLLINSCTVDAGIFIKAKDPLIIQEAVWLYSNSTAITSIAPDVPANRFSLTVAPIDNLPQASVDGTNGVLYNRDDSCSPDTINQPIPIPFYAVTAKLSKVPKIALIKKQGGNCTMIEKIRNAQLEGAIGAILYDSDGSTNLEDRKAGVPPNNDIKIPAFYVDHKVGSELYYQLQKMAGVPLATIPTFDNSPLTTRISVRIALMPADNIKPTAWELTLLVMLILLGTSIMFSVAMHFFMWRRNQRLQEMVERHRTTAAAAAVLPMGKALLTMTRLYQFPTRTVDKVLNEEERRKIETVLLDEKKREALKKSTELNSKEPKRKSVFSKTKLLGKQSSNIVDAPVNNMCVICLEAFKMGDEIRELPCYHEYHITCIDPWLTSKSCECPLCKFDCSDPKLEETTVADPDGLIAANSVPGLHGKILRTYLRFKANRRKRLGQVGITNDDVEHQQQEVRAISRQSTMMSPPSPNLVSAFRALDTVEITELPITAIADMDEHYKAYEVAQSNEEVEDSQSFVTDLPRQSTATDRTATTNYRANNTYNETESHSRYSVATTNRDETDTIHTTTANSISTYAPTSDGGLLPDIDVSSISLCSIDLGGLSEDFHKTFNYNRVSDK